MSYGLVLEGGGAKGSYQMGAYMAVLEEGLEISAVVGTSIGALNGAFIVQGAVEALLEVWKNAAFSTGEDFLEAYGKLKGESFPNPIHLFQTVRSAGQVDPKPLKELIHRHIDEEKIRNSPLDYGLTVYSLSENKTKSLFVDEIPRGKLNSYLEASCTFPIFPPVKIDGKLYMDGGLGNNLPFEMVLDRGLTPVILRTNPPAEGEKMPPGALVVAPRAPLGGTLDFDPMTTEERMQRGYRHAKRILGGYDGYDYAFEPMTEEEAMVGLMKLFYTGRENFRYMISREFPLERGIWEELFPKLAGELELPQNYSYKELYLGLLEARGAMVQLPHDGIYRADAFEKLLRRDGSLGPRPSLGEEGALLPRVLHLLFSTYGKALP
ncbi:MAG: patatin-like phospholipase family protein [Tissierellia bacterium]|nr:patatin-like phospholipase family protein [Tissierellia bacterium]